MGPAIDSRTPRAPSIDVSSNGLADGLVGRLLGTVVAGRLTDTHNGRTGVAT